MYVKQKGAVCVYFKCCARQYSVCMLSKTGFQQVLDLNPLADCVQTGPTLECVQTVGEAVFQHGG